MTISASEYAAMASASYGFIKGADPLTKLSAFDSRLDKSLYRVLVAKNEYTVFSKISTGEVVCAIKGTSTAGDWASNSLIAVGALGSDPRLRELINVIRRYKKDGVDISVTGHSLGGALATALAKREDVLAVTFNTGSFLAENTATDRANSFALGEKSENVVQFNTGTDVLSIASAHINPMTGSATFFVDSTASNAHSMENFRGLDDTPYQTDIDKRARRTKDFRSDNPDTRVDEYTRADQLEQVANDAKNLIAKFKEVKAYYDTAKAMAKSKKENIPKNLIVKWNSFKNDVNSVYKSLKRFNQARIDRNLQEAYDAGQELIENVDALRQHGTFDRFLKDISMDSAEGDGLLVEAFQSVENGESQLDMEFEGFEEMEVYDVGDGLDPLDDGEGLGFDADVTEFDAVDEGGEGVLDILEEDAMAGFGESDALLVEDGSLEVVEIVAREAGTLAASMSRVGNIVGGVLAAAAVIVVIVMEIVGNNEKQKRLHREEVKIASIVSDFSVKFRQLCHKTNITIPQNRRPPVVGTHQQYFITQHVSYPWNDYDLYGDSVYTYLEYRLKNPQVFFRGDALGVLSKLHMKYFSPGVPFCLPREGMGEGMTLHNNPFKSELNELRSRTHDQGEGSDLFNAMRENEGVFDESAYLLIYNAFSRFRVNRNKGAYESELRSFLAQHKQHSFDEMSEEFKEKYTYKLMYTVQPGVRQYLNEIWGMADYTQSLPDSVFARPETKGELRTAVRLFHAHLVSFVTSHPETANNRLVEFEKTHSVAAFHRGLEELTSVYGMDTWLYNNEHDLTHFQTIFDLGALKILTGPVRSLVEQRSVQKLIEHEIKNSNLGFEAFYAAGNPGQGDNETVVEFRDRVTRWVSDRARANQVAFSRGPGYRKPVDVVYTVSRGVDGLGPSPIVPPDSTGQSIPAVVDADSIVCGFRPSKKYKWGP